MKIIINQVPQGGLYLEEEASAKELDLETDLIKFRTPLKLNAHVFLITNALTVELNIRAVLFSNCSRCLEEFEWKINKDTQLNYSLGSRDVFIDLSDDIREEVILDYPIKPLCRSNCKGLCVQCGKNKNQGGCNCGST
ncbi:MAG: DUF177 domain-containing protein [Candidatus Omnitrophica bacterium]|nr:DUF177 domain-containing protein [Candidatus Omnitrophota bacterium]